MSAGDFATAPARSRVQGTRVRPMPWQGHNQKVLEERSKPPRLPPNWGSSFGQAATMKVEPHASNALDHLRALARGLNVRERLLTLLEAIELRGLDLPDIRTLAELLDTQENDVRSALAALVRVGTIRMLTERHTRAVWHRVIALPSGSVLRSAGAPLGWRP